MLRRCGLVNRARDEIAEAFAGLVILRKGGKLLGEYLEDAVLADILRVKAVQPLAVEAAAEGQIIFSGCASRQRHSGDDQILIGCQAEAALVHLRNRPQAAHDRAAGQVGYAAVLNEQPEIEKTAIGLAPAEAVAVGRELERARRLERSAHAPLDL